jgi:gamma-D-glutamyl-L-lysine dipeptidyl-peptidase
MKYGINKLALISVRAKASDRDEIVTQLLFGEIFTIVDETEKWIKIINHFDSYEGWICKKQYKDISKEQFDLLSKSPYEICLDKFSVLNNIIINDEILIPTGSILYNLKEDLVSFLDTKYIFKGKIASKDFKDVEKYAMKFLNSPYLWGGKGIMGIDCSGFTQLVYSLCGISIPRDASEQEKKGKVIYSVNDSEKGDLVFFKNDKEKINHVGIYLGNNNIIHASGKVRIDRVDDQGIFKSGSKTHNFHSIKRLF